MSTKKRSRFRPNPKLTNHAAYKNLHAGWRKQILQNGLEMFQARDFAGIHFLRPLELASVENLSITSACTYYRARKLPCPSPELLLKRCREVPPEQMEIQVNHALEQQFQALPRKVRQGLRRQGMVIVDFHVDPYYGDPTTPYVTTGPVKQSTNRGFCYLTAELYAPGGNQTIAVVVRRPGERTTDLFWDLFNRIEFILQPKIFLLDGAFATVEILEGLQTRGIAFVARKAITRRLRPLALAYSLTDNWEALRTFRAIAFLDRTKTRETTVQVTFQQVQGAMKALVVAFGATLMPTDAEQLYRHRFSIETGYRDKHPFQARTCSRHLSVRLLLFLFAIMLWNLWQTFLYLVQQRQQPSGSCLILWRRQLRIIKLFLLRDELL